AITAEYVNRHRFGGRGEFLSLRKFNHTSLGQRFNRALYVVVALANQLADISRSHGSSRLFVQRGDLCHILTPPDRNPARPPKRPKRGVFYCPWAGLCRDSTPSVAVTETLDACSGVRSQNTSRCRTPSSTARPRCWTCLPAKIRA